VLGVSPFTKRPNFAQGYLGANSSATVTILDEDVASQADTTPPSITGTPNRSPNADGWYNTPVTITFTATDDGSGVASVTAPLTLFAEGINQSAVGQATDNAGNTARTTVSNIDIDLTKPITSASAANNINASGNAQITLTASDALSGIKSTHFQIDGGAQQTYSGPFNVNGDSTHTITYSSIDKAGNIEDTKTLTLSTSGSTLTTVPTTMVIHASGNLANVGDTVTFVAVVTPASGTGIPTGIVLFTIDGTPQTPVSVQAIDGQVEASFTTTTLAAGVHKIQATYSGDASFSTSSTSSSFVATAAALAPTVTSLVRFGIHMQPTVLVLAFSAPLDASTAQDVANYRITGPEHGRIAIKSAIYDPTRNTVTLKPKHRIDIHYTYHLLVIGTGSGGVRSANGIFLDGAGSHVPGSNYITTLDCRNLAITGVEARKVLHLKHVKPGGALIFPFASRKGIVSSR
jgi:Bacterial Ig-like domain (group 3)